MLFRKARPARHRRQAPAPGTEHGSGAHAGLTGGGTAGARPHWYVRCKPTPEALVADGTLADSSTDAPADRTLLQLISPPRHLKIENKCSIIAPTICSPRKQAMRQGGDGMQVGFKKEAIRRPACSSSALFWFRVRRGLWYKLGYWARRRRVHPSAGNCPRHFLAGLPCAS